MTNAEAKSIVDAINTKQIELQSCSNDDLRKVVLSCNLVDVYASVKELAYRLSCGDVVVSPTSLDRRLAADEQFDFVEIIDDLAVYHHSWRVYNDILEWKMVHYNEQLEAGVFLHEGYALEMATGEGKTLVATLPVVLNGLLGKNVHLMTVNSYLSRRDYELTRPIYAFFGLSSDCIELYKYGQENRKNAYNANIVFGTNSEFAWDYLRDHLALDACDIHQHAHDFAIIDELDSILVDNAVDPHIIGGGKHYNQREQYALWKSAIVELLEDNTLYEVDKVHASAKFTSRGERWISQREEWKKCRELISREGAEYEHYWANVQHQLLIAYTLYNRNIDYIIYEGKVVIIDQSTGRRRDSSRWEHGLHTAVEVKEGVLVRNDNQSMASISIKNYFKLYEKCAGMSGTVLPVADELLKSYGLASAKIATHNPCIRVDEPMRVYTNTDAKNRAVAKYVTEVHNQGRPVLIGCRDMEQSNKLAQVLQNTGLDFELLDARDFGLESWIVSQAGIHGKILLSTSMAGRGTDIKPDAEAIAAGGLAVVGTDLFFSERVEKQLRGRAGRQGDPGTSVLFTSADDFLVDYLPPLELKRLRDLASAPDSEEITSPETIALMRHAQEQRELYFASMRMENARKDDIIAPHRKDFYQLRQNILCAVNIEEPLRRILASEEELLAFDILCSSFWEKAVRLSKQSVKDFQRGNKLVLPLACLPDTFVVEVDLKKIDNADYFRSQFIKQIMLQVYDEGWKEFVEYMMQDLSHDQVDTLVWSFMTRIQAMDNTIHNRLLHSSIPINAKTVADAPIHHRTMSRSSYMVSSACDLEQCPCGSGKPFSQCHGTRKQSRRR